MTQWLFPREHGTYGELLFPLATAFAIAGWSSAGALFAAAAVLGFLSHEGLSVLRGGRGGRSLREQFDPARRSLGIFGSAALAAGTAAVLIAPPAARGGFLVAAALSAVMLAAAWSGRERTLAAEAAVALALSAWALPVMLAGNVTWATALVCWMVWSATLVTGTLAVHAVIARTRRQPVVALIGSALGVSCGVFGVSVWLALSGRAPGTLPWSLVPALFVAVATCSGRARATHLRRLGWSLVLASALTMAVLVAAYAR